MDIFWGDAWCGVVEFLDEDKVQYADGEAVEIGDA